MRFGIIHLSAFYSTIPLKKVPNLPQSILQSNGKFKRTLELIET
jgi:hypothetical protein